MTAAQNEQVLTAPVRPRRADRGANAHPRSTAPAAAGPRAASWVHVPRSTPNVEAATARALGAPRFAGEPELAPVIRLREDTVRVRRIVAEPRYEWTPRGLAVLLALVAVVVGLMAATLVAAFLAVSDAPLPAAPPALLAGLHPGAPAS